MKTAFTTSERKKLNAPQTGKVKSQPKNICAAILGFVPFFLQRPTPIIAQVFACVVAVGIPKKEQTPKNDDDAVSAALLFKGSSVVISHPTYFIIREPPISVPSVIAAAKSRLM